MRSVVLACSHRSYIAFESGFFVVGRHAGLEHGVGRLDLPIAMIAGNDDRLRVGVVGNKIHDFPPVKV